MNPSDPQASAADTPVSRKRVLVGLPIALAAFVFGRPAEDAAAGTDGDWTLHGNSVKAGAYIGTKNAKPLILKTRKKTRLKISPGGDVGIGAAPAAARLRVAAPAANGPKDAIKGETKATNGKGVVGTAPNSIGTALNAMGVQGLGTVGVQGTGEFMGVQGNSLSYGVFGVTNPDTGGIGSYGRGDIGVKGRSYAGRAVLGDTDSGTGVKGESYSGGGSVKAMYGQAFGLNSNGVVGEASNGTAAYGLWGISTNGYAGVFSGKAIVSGTLSKGGGAFKIDHPLDPENKYLYHSFVESPDMMNVYNGNVRTGADGRAVIELPDWFEALNRDFRYQLTVIGQFAQAIVASGVAGNRFAIETDKPNVDVSWQVTGIRRDAFANANRIPVEEKKDDDERGLFLHPLEHGRREADGVYYARIEEGRARAAARQADPMPL